MAELGQLPEPTLIMGGGGTLNEGNAFAAAEWLRALKRAVDAGNISPREFLERGKPVAQFLSLETFRLSSQSSAGASKSTQLRDESNPSITGFDLSKKTPGKFDIALSPELTEKIGEELLPEPPPPLDEVTGTEPTPPPTGTPEDISEPPIGLPNPVISTPDPRIPGEDIEIPVVDRDVPQEISPVTDQFKIEKEALRQQEQSRKAFEAQRAFRAKRLTDLADLLGKEEERKFGLAQPKIAEGAQASGLLRSSGFGDALARERTNLAGETAFQLGQQGLSDREAEVLGISQILGQRQGFQSGGLQREFSLEDFERQSDLSRSIGAAATPVQSGGGKGGVAQGGFSGALGGAGIGATFGAPGAAVGGLIGGLGGAVTGGKS